MRVLRCNKVCYISFIGIRTLCDSVCYRVSGSGFRYCFRCNKAATRSVLLLMLLLRCNKVGFRCNKVGALAHALALTQGSVIAMLEAFVHDPLINWRLLAAEATDGRAAGAAGLGNVGKEGREADLASGASMASKQLSLVGQQMLSAGERRRRCSR